MRMKGFYILVWLMMSGITAFGQTQKAFLRAAEDAMNSENYYAALDYYLEALEFDTSNVSLMFNAAEAAREFDSYDLAEQLYTDVVAEDNDASYPTANFHLAYVQQMQGKYDMALRNYELYLSQFQGDDQRMTDRANKEISSIEWAQGKISNPDPAVRVNNLGGAINTPYSEIGAVRDGDNIVFSSVKFHPENRKQYSDKHIAKVLTSTDSLTTFEIAEDFNKPNTHTANVAFNMNRSKIFYTVCEYITDDEIRCDLYCRAILGDGTFGVETKLPESINSMDYTSTQPNIGFDKTSGQEILYFVSDRPGGKGGLDIWASNITGVESFADPINLADINTGGDDMSPFYHNNSQVLFFSTDGDMSLGGFDVYRSLNDGGQFQKAENLGAPVNSSYNDVYYKLADDAETALFSSNRVGSQYIDDKNKSCCYDVYEAQIGDLEINLNVLTFDGKSLDSLEGVTVQLIDARTGAILNTITNDIGAEHIFQVERGKEYLIVSARPGYVTDTLPLNTNSIIRSEDIIRKVYLERSTLELQVFTFDEISREPLNGTTVILEDLTDNSVQTITITNESSNDFVFDITPGNSYRITATRDRYYDSFKEFVANDVDGSGIIRKELFLTRRDLNIYLPLALYFNNDIPDERSRALTTSLTYSETFDDFVIQKFNFVEEYTRTLSGSEKELAEERIAKFFDEDVNNGYDRFTRFVDFIIGQLQDGRSFDISLRGFASPRADTKYNLALSQRRVVSVLNELRGYRQGILVPFIENGQLKITELSYGESLAPDNVSDVLYDRRNSIYSPEASRERRVEIVEIKQGSPLLNNEN